MFNCKTSQQSHSTQNWSTFAKVTEKIKTIPFYTAQGTYITQHVKYRRSQNRTLAKTVAEQQLMDTYTISPFQNRSQ